MPVIAPRMANQLLREFLWPNSQGLRVATKMPLEEERKVLSPGPIN